MAIRNRDDWLHKKVPDCGTDVYDERDPRHIGELRAVVHDNQTGTWANIKWHETGWRSSIRPKYVRVYNGP